MTVKNRIARTIAVASLTALIALPLGLRAGAEGVSGTARPPFPPSNTVVQVTSTYTLYANGIVVLTNGTMITTDGTTWFTDGSILYADGTFVPAPTGN